MRIRDRLRPVVSTQMAPPSDPQLRPNKLTSRITHSPNPYENDRVCKAKLFNFRTWVFARQFFDNFLVVADFSLCKDRARNNNKTIKTVRRFFRQSSRKGKNLCAWCVCSVKCWCAPLFFHQKNSHLIEFVVWYCVKHNHSPPPLQSLEYCGDQIQCQKR